MYFQQSQTFLALQQKKLSSSIKQADLPYLNPSNSLETIAMD